VDETGIEPAASSLRILAGSQNEFIAVADLKLQILRLALHGGRRYHGGARPPRGSLALLTRVENISFAFMKEESRLDQKML
jgi:hypothetical protein